MTNSKSMLWFPRHEISWPHNRSQRWNWNGKGSTFKGRETFGNEMLNIKCETIRKTLPGPRPSSAAATLPANRILAHQRPHFARYSGSRDV